MIHLSVLYVYIFIKKGIISLPPTLLSGISSGTFRHILRVNLGALKFFFFLDIWVSKMVS